ncbi:MAG: hypothetical protein IPG15_06710 [Arcobacter sp.]|nr:hypothetical protein [Arcobacter sp.]
MNAGNDFLPTNINCNRCKERDSISKNNSSVLLVNVLSVSVPDRTPSASTSPSPSSSVEPSETPTISPSTLPTPTASPTESN